MSHSTRIRTGWGYNPKRWTICANCNKIGRMCPEHKAQAQNPRVIKRLKCPKCSGGMRLREPKLGQTWEPFWGCAKYPECRGTQSTRQLR